METSRVVSFKVLRSSRRLALLLGLVVLCLGLAKASAAGVTVLYSFAATETPGSSVTNMDGSGPTTPLTRGQDGNFYGVTQHGGPYGGGTIFSLGLSNGLTTLYSFPVITDDYGIPFHDFGPNQLIQGTNGYFYGTTHDGGTNRNGTIYQMSPLGRVIPLYVFSAATLDVSSASGSLTNADGANPTGALVAGGDGNFYGVTQYGGANGAGAIFQLTPAGAFTCVYSFNALDAFGNNAEGTTPNALVLGSDGAFYGTTQTGGANGAGGFYRFTLSGGVVALYSFGTLTSDPALPKSALTQGPNGCFYGTSAAGGANGSGAIFEATPMGVVQVLYSFPVNDDGGDSGAALTLGSDGNFYGTTDGDGANGTGTLFELTPAGAYLKLYSFSALSATTFVNKEGADPFAALALGSDGNLYGACSDGGVNASGSIFRFSSATFVPPNLPASITKEPVAKLSGLAGSSVSIGVTAKGAATLAYQWRRDGTNLSDGGEIAESATPTLIISHLQASDAGSYFVIVTNSYSVVTSTICVLTVLPDKVLPVVTVTSPAVNARTNAPVFKGTASDNVLVTNVVCWLTNVGSHLVLTNPATLSAGTGGLSNWTVAFALLPGTNILAAQSMDFSGNKSKIVSRAFFYSVPANLALAQTGDGRVTGAAAASNASLYVGQGYSLTATPGKYSWFTNWTSGGSAFSTNLVLNFIMPENMQLQANFVTNLFLQMAGAYNGLFYPESGVVTKETAGMIGNLTLSSLGAYTALFSLDGPAVAIHGTFNRSGFAENVVHTAVGNVQVSMNLLWNNTPRQITGLVTGTNQGVPWTSDLHLIATPSSTGRSAEYTMLLPSGTNPPVGTGYALITNHSGMLTLAGALADGTTFNQTVPVNEAAGAPLYASLYANTGLLLGWLDLDTGVLGSAVPASVGVTWIKKATHAGLFTNGFTNVLSATGSIWTNPPAKTAAIPLTGGQLDVSGSFLTSGLMFTNVSVTSSNTLFKSGFPTNSLTGTIAPKTGLLTLSFGNGKGKATTAGLGAVLQNQTNASGFFLTTTNTGAISLQPPAE